LLLLLPNQRFVVGRGSTAFAIAIVVDVSATTTVVVANVVAVISIA